MRKTQLLALLLSLTLFCSGLFDMQVSAEPVSGSEGMMILENDNLLVGFKDNGSFVVTDKKSGEKFASSLSTEHDQFSEVKYRRTVSSELLVYYYLTEEELTSDLTEVSYSITASAEVLQKDDQICVKYDFSECEVKVNVEYSLKGECLEASIDLDSIEEYGKYSVSKIELLAGFGAGTDTDTGYMLVPDGSGALIHYNNGETQLYQQDIYGEETSQKVSLKKAQSETARMPVFGIVRNSTAVFGIVDEGDAIAGITAFSGNALQNYNSVYSGINLTFTSEKNMFANDHKNSSTAYDKADQTSGIDSYTVKYYFLAADDATYSGMAKVYREYLVEEKGLEKKVSSPTLNVDLYGAIDVKRNFLGLTYYKPIALTTYQQVTEIADELKDLGIENLSVRYLGWNNDGLSNERVLKKLKTMRVLGGKKQYNKMNKSLEELGVDIIYDVDFTKFYKGAKSYKIMDPFNEVLESARYLRSVYATDINKRTWYQLTPSKWNQVSEKVLSSVSGLDIEKLSLSNLTSDIYSDFRTSAPYTRGDTEKTSIGILNDATQMLEVYGDTANAYAFPYVSKIYEAPAYTSGYFILNEEVPFYQMALHGYVDMTAPAQFTSDNTAINYLKAVESGMQLLYTGIYTDTAQVRDTDYDALYGTDYRLWSSDALEKYATYQPLLEKIYDSEITKHEKIAENVYQTSYANGVSVIVNYNDTAVEVRGMKVAEYGFCEVVQ